jgi:high-affinity Fe2+/Pb2+ permease
MTRKGIASDPSRRARILSGVGVALFFAGLISFGVARVFMVLHFGAGIAVVSFSAGVLLCGLALIIHDRHRRSR